VTKAVGASTLRLTANLSDRAELSRTITVPAQGRLFEIESTITNTDQAEQPAGARVSFDLDLGPARDVVVTVAGGSPRNVPTSADGEALAIDAAQLAAGVTVARRSGGPGVRIVASGPGLKGAEIRGDATGPRVTVTLTIDGTLPAGGSSTLHQTVELLPAAGGR
jgi:hypothetical protein